MQHWEYLEVYCLLVDINNNLLPQPEISANGRRVNPEPLSIPHYINELGDQGWELVGYQFTSGVRTYIFKRLKP